MYTGKNELEERKVQSVLSKMKGKKYPKNPNDIVNNVLRYKY